MRLAPTSSVPAAASTPAVPPTPPAPAARPAPPTLPPAPPDLAGMVALARSHPQYAWKPGATLAAAHNAHYTNRRDQLAWALDHDYNSIEGDVRLRDGRAVMMHTPAPTYEQTFDDWAAAVAASGRMMRVDVKEVAALPSIMATLDRLKVPGDHLTFNLSTYAPWLTSDLAIAKVRELRAHYPGSWLTLNVSMPLVAGWISVARGAHSIGGGRIGMALQAPIVTGTLVSAMKHAGLMVNVWNYPPAWAPGDVAAYAAKLRGMGVDGMIDLRRTDDPLANP